MTRKLLSHRRFLSFRIDVAKLNEMAKTKLGMRVCGTALVKPLSGNFDHYVKMFSKKPFIILLTTKW